jgi:dipeptidase
MVALPSATRHAQTLFAKNSDRPANECQPLERHERQTHAPGTITHCQFVQLPQAPATYRHIGSRPYWCWGYEHGFNEHQVVIGNEGLRSRIQTTEPKLVGMELLRLGLERARTAAEAVEVITDLVTRYGQGISAVLPDAGRYDNGYLVADPREAYIVETAGHHWAVKPVEKTVGISNIYALGTDWDRLAPEAQAYARERGWWSGDRERFDFGQAFSEDGEGDANGSGGRRRRRSCAVLEQQAGAIDAALLMALLGDHSDATRPQEPFQTSIGEGGICMHYDLAHPDRSTNTAASLVADLCADGSRLPVYWCSFYAPCLGVFYPVFLEGTLPPGLSVGGALPEEASLWWLFHRLNHLVREDPQSRIPLVRKEWAVFQERLFESAYPLACEGQRLIEKGQPEAAHQRLSAYMHAQVSEMEKRARQMMATFLAA